MSKPSVNNALERTIFGRVTQLLSEAKELKPAQVQQGDEPALQLTDYHLSYMAPGTYEFELAQKVKIGSKTVEDLSTSAKAVVEAPLLPINMADVYHHYPPKRAMGDYSEVLPHVVLKSHLMPWQLRHKDSPSDPAVPWLALVLLTEDETEMLTKPGKKVKIPKELLPPAATLRYLTHVAKTPDGEERAVLIANRLGVPGKNNIVHVVALHEESEDDTYTSLFNWTFTCEAESNTFQNILNHLDCGLLRVPEAKLPEKYKEDAKNKRVQAYNKCLQNGFVPLPHFARNGQRIMSWYRSPLTPYNVNTTFRMRYINHSDHLLRYFKESKRFDTTYAAAWELGRWLTLQQKEIAEALYNWKREIALIEKKKIRQKRQEKRKQGKELAKTEQMLSVLFAGSDVDEDHPIPEQVRQWLLSLVRLSAVPFSYLIPDERMLPDESLRFFHVDEGWIWALIDGALSIGRLPTTQPNQPVTVPELHLTGCIMRSDAVQMFPDFGVTANGSMLPVEKRKIGQDIMFCLFYKKEEPIKTLEVFLQSGDTHFGVDRAIEEGQSVQYFKQFFKRPEEKKLKTAKANVPFLDYENRIIDIEGFAKTMEANGENKSSTFSLRMFEAIPKVIFKSK